MNQEIKKLWVDALRSGKYKQGVGALHRNINGKDFFCCLGVLCDVLMKNGTENFEVKLIGGNEIKTFSYDNRISLIPTDLGIFSDDATTDEIIQNELAELNDNFVSFEEIAKKIEKEL